MSLSAQKADFTWIRMLAHFMALLLVLAVFIGGAHPQAGSLFMPPWDKVAHVGLYFALFLLLHAGYSRNTWRIALFVILIGIADEIHQIGLPARHPGWGDLAADCIGVLSAVVLRQVLLKKNIP